MLHYDLCLAWNWEYDADFVRLMNETCTARGLSLLDISAHNRDEILPLLSRREIGFRALLDRASESDSSYLPLVEIAKSIGARRLNPRELADRAYDKAAMHRLFQAAGIHIPRTLILPSFQEQPLLTFLDLSPLHGQFVAKPALGGGGDGVVTGLSTFEHVGITRRQFPEQQYLLQDQVTPKFMNGLPTWFRVIYCLGGIFPCFWDTTTHVYTPVDSVGAVLRDSPLREITKRIARLCQLDLFSTEICLTEENRLLVVDYVNDPIDLRLQSRTVDGVPDFIVERIAMHIVEEIKINADG
jgi:hypothetical protein